MTRAHPGNGRGAWNPAEVEEIATRLAAMPGALLPVLHAVQERLGCIPAEAVPIIARVLNLSRAEVHGVVTFYHDFRPVPPGRNIIRICRAESCQAMGAVALSEHAQRRLGIEFGQTSSDGAFTLEPVYCLGNCACSPAMVVGDAIHGRVTPERFDEILAHATQPRRS